MKKVQLIPRNLVEDDSNSIKIAFGIKLRIIDFPILLTGFGCGYFLAKNFGGAITIQALIYLLSVGIAFIITQLKYEDQRLTELGMNSAFYLGRKSNYKNRRKIRRVK